MSSKLGLILSMIFVSLFFLLGIDLISIQFIYSDLDSKGITIGYRISKEGRVDSSFISSLSKMYNVTIENISPSSVKFGDVVEYVLYQEYKPIIVSNDVMKLRVKRSAVIGYYG